MYIVIKFNLRLSSISHIKKLQWLKGTKPHRQRQIRLSTLTLNKTTPTACCRPNAVKHTESINAQKRLPT